VGVSAHRDEVSVEFLTVEGVVVGAVVHLDPV